MSTLLKRVKVFKSGKQIKEFDCRACDLSNHVITFNDVVPKRRNDRRRITLQYVGDSYVEIDREKRECLVIPENPDIQIFITW